jgi:hypothetical protein
MKTLNAERLRTLNHTIEQLTQEATRLTQKMRIARVQRDRLLKSIDHGYMEEAEQPDQFGTVPTPEQYFAAFQRELSDLELELLARRLADASDSLVDPTPMRSPISFPHARRAS